MHDVKNGGVLLSRRRDLRRRNSAKWLFLGKDKKHDLSWTSDYEGQYDPSNFSPIFSITIISVSIAQQKSDPLY